MLAKAKPRRSVRGFGLLFIGRRSLTRGRSGLTVALALPGPSLAEGSAPDFSPARSLITFSHEWSSFRS